MGILFQITCFEEEEITTVLPPYEGDLSGAIELVFKDLAHKGIPRDYLTIDNQGEHWMGFWRFEPLKYTIVKLENET